MARNWLGSPYTCVITGCEEELDEVLRENKLISEREGNFYFIKLQYSESDSDDEEVSLRSMIK